MRLLAALTLCALFLTAQVLAKGDSQDDSYFQFIPDGCDNRKDGQTAETCCKAPALKNYAIKLLAPTDGSCVNIATEIPFSWELVDNSHGSFTQVEEPAFQLFLQPNPLSDPANVGKGELFPVPVCVGDGSRQDKYFTSTNHLRSFLGASKYRTFGFYFNALPKSGNDTVFIYDAAGTDEKIGIWLSEDCEQLQRDMCDGKVPDPPKKNHFYKYAMKRCDVLGRG